MKDIDFDELDRAVNSLMSGVPKAEPAQDDDITSLPASHPAADDAVSEPETEETASVAMQPVQKAEEPRIEDRPASPAAPSATVPPAIRRRGRFMDVVRPATPEPSASGPSRPVSRSGATIQPSAGFSRPSASPQDITPPARPVPAPSSAPSATDWPDPLAAIEFDKTTEAVTVKATQTTARVMSSAPSSGANGAIKALDLPESPFLPDAKVEKRPLGRSSDADGSSAPEPDHAPVLGALAVSGNAAAEGASDDSAIPEQPLPAEYGHDVMAIEADMGNTSPEETREAEVAPRPVAASVPTTPRPTVTSIPQQYKVQPSVGEPTPGAIYDTAAYHQPLVHPAKKKPGWLWVVAIILILILGAASGAAVYFFGAI